MNRVDACGPSLGNRQISMLGDIILDRGSAALGGGSGVKFFFYWLYDVALTGFAAFLTAYFASGVGGSGIPVRPVASTPQCFLPACLLWFPSKDSVTRDEPFRESAVETLEKN